MKERKKKKKEKKKKKKKKRRSKEFCIIFNKIILNILKFKFLFELIKDIIRCAIPSFYGCLS